MLAGAPVATQSPAPAPPAVPPAAATTAAPPETVAPDAGEVVVNARSRKGDPFEAVNAQSYGATQKADRAIVGPVAMAYKNGIPKPIRSGLHNFLANLREPVVFLNFLIQLRPGKAAETVGRFAINTTIGGAGLFDIAKRRPFRLPPRVNGFADSLGFYGVRPGPFFFLPLIGPTTVRDLIGDTVDRLLVPLAAIKPFNRPAYAIPATIILALDYRVAFDADLQKIRATRDPYASARRYYLDDRQREIDHLRGKPTLPATPVLDTETLVRQPLPPEAPTPEPLERLPD